MNSQAPTHLRVLSLDIGSKRIGLALWNPLTKLANPLAVRHRKTLKIDLEFFKELVRKHEVQAFLVGLPISLGGTSTQSTENARFWIETLKTQFSIPVFSYDESLSTRDALEAMRHKKRQDRQQMKDSIAAAIILEGFMQDFGEGSPFIGDT